MLMDLNTLIKRWRYSELIIKQGDYVLSRRGTLNIKTQVGGTHVYIVRTS